LVINPLFLFLDSSILGSVVALYVFKTIAMKYFLFLVAAFALNPWPANANYPKPMPLTEVQLYLQSAKLTHKGAVQLVSGKQIIVLKGLASELD
jgi:hypothetical protein